MPRTCIYSDEEMLSLLTEVKEVASKELHRDCFLSMNLFDEYIAKVVGEEGAITSMAYLPRFGSWNNAKELAGLPTRKATHQYKEYSESECLDCIKKAFKYVKNNYGKENLSIEDYRFYRESENSECPTVRQIRRKVGKWSLTKEKAGINENDVTFTVPEYCDFCIEKDQCSVDNMKNYTECDNYYADYCM